MLFRTRPEFEFNFGTPSEWLEDTPGTQHWRAFEWVFHDFWFLVEFLTEEGLGEDRTEFWKTTCCTELSPVLDLAQNDNVLEHRINLVIPAYASPNRQIELKPIQAIYSDGEDVYDVITSDGVKYVWPKDSASATDAKSKIYFKQSIDVFTAPG